MEFCSQAPLSLHWLIHHNHRNLAPQSDQSSFGLVLYELITGHRAFRRGSRAETMAAIIRDEPEPIPAHTLGPLRWVIERLLAKDPAELYDSSRD
jgi:hypothetical protein